MARNGKMVCLGKYADHYYTKPTDRTCARCKREKRRYTKGGPATWGAPPSPPQQPLAAALPLVTAEPVTPQPPAPPIQPLPPPPPGVDPVMAAVGPPPAAPPAPTPESEEARKETEAKRIKIRKLHDYLGRRAFDLTEALVDRGIAWARNNPNVAESDPEERVIIGEGFAELSKQAFGEHELTPWGKVGVGTFFMAAGKFAATHRLEPVQPKSSETTGTLRVVPPPADQQG